MKKVDIMSKKEYTLTDGRNYGIDALRLLAMFFVTVLHVLGHGGVLDNVTGIKSDIAWMLEIFAFCAVNCYGIVSGLVMYSETEKAYCYSKYISMWLQVFFYSFGITLLTFIIEGGNVVSIRLLIKSALPVIGQQYWYFNSYTGLFFIIPLLNRLVRTFTERQLTTIILCLFIAFSCVRDSFYFNGGYSTAWLVVLYLFGAWLKKCDIPTRIRSRYAFGILIISVLTTWLFKAFSPVVDDLFVSYLSPTIILNALCLVVIFSRLRVNNTTKTAIKFLSPAAFGVYLIHEQTLIRKKFIACKFIWIADLDWWMIPLWVICCALSIFLICLIIEEIRIALFNLLKINKLAQSVFIRIQMLLKKSLSKFLDYCNISA